MYYILKSIKQFYQHKWNPDQYIILSNFNAVWMPFHFVLNVHPTSHFLFARLSLIFYISESNTSTEELSEPQAERVTPDLCRPKEPVAGSFLPYIWM